MSQFEIVTTAERVDLHDQFESTGQCSWPEFILHDAISHQFAAVRERFPRYDATVVDLDQYDPCARWRRRRS
jgi:hypothetical protein